MDKNRGGRKSSSELGRFAALLTENEPWLMRRVLRYAKERGYTRYTSTLEEAWRVSIAGLTESLITSIEARGWDLELVVDEDLTQDPAMSFGILEAQRHRSRGITLTMYLGLTKYYRQAYLDLADELAPAQSARKYRHAIGRFFDRVEIGFCEEWLQQSGSDLLTELQEQNRTMTNEKNKFLTVFDSISSPVALLDAEGRIDAVNAAAGKAFQLGSVSGSSYYSAEAVGEPFRPLELDIAVFVDGSAAEATMERLLQTVDGPRWFMVRFSRMLDVSGKYAGATVILSDVTERKDAEEALRSMSLRDDLTGVHNRRGFEVVGRQLLTLANRLGRTPALIYIDVDDLKEINDTRGHQSGDRALRAVAELLRDTFRESDVVARMGGDEFAVLLAGEDEGHIGEAVARLRAAADRLAVPGDGEMPLTFSLGVVYCSEAPECELDRLVAIADGRMYESKLRRRADRVDEEMSDTQE